jgi:hypothetical protein
MKMFKYFTESTEWLMYYRSLYAVIAVILLLAILSFLRKSARPISGNSWFLILPAIISLLAAAASPLYFRMRIEETPALLWECDSYVEFFEAAANNQGIWDFAVNAVVRKPGVLAESAKTLFFGVPTYSVLRSLGWSTFNLHLVSFFTGIAAILLGAYLVRLWFDRATALCFMVVFAVNPLVVHYMGYAVAETATLFGVLLAAFFIFNALLLPNRVVLNSLGAIITLYFATLNYGPGRIFVVSTLIFLGLVVVWAAYSRSVPRKIWLTSLMILIGASGWLVAENRLNNRSDFTSMRQEHAFYQHQWRDNLIDYLGDTPEVRALVPGQLSTSWRIRFIGSVIQRRFQDLVRTLSPFYRIPFTTRGSTGGDDIRPYQSGLFVLMVIGFIAALRNYKSIGNLYVFSFFFIGACPLLLVNRLDLHRFFLLVFPISVWMAQGLWLCLKRVYALGLPPVVISGLTCIFSLSLAVSNYYVQGIQQTAPADLASVMQAVKDYPEDLNGLGHAGLICQHRGWIEKEFMRLVEGKPSVSRAFLPWRFADELRDGVFNVNNPKYEDFKRRLGESSIGFISTYQHSELVGALGAEGFLTNIRQFGSFSLVVAKQQP